MQTFYAKKLKNMPYKPEQCSQRKV